MSDVKYLVYLIASGVGFIAIFLMLMAVPMPWSGHYSEFRTPRQYFKECWDVTVPPNAKLLIDEREREYRLVWQCIPEEIAAIEKNPPAKYYHLPWKKFDYSSWGKFSPVEREHVIYLKGRDLPHSFPRLLVLDKAKSQLIGLAIDDGW